MQDKRKTLFVDQAVQGSLLLHILCHWVLFLFVTGAVLFFVELMTVDPRTALGGLIPRHSPTFLVVLVLTPIFIRDLCKLSNRFAGPMVRLQHAMKELAEGRDVSPVEFRKNDFWKDVASDFNRVAERVRMASPPNENDKEVAPESLNVNEYRETASTISQNQETM